MEFFICKMSLQKGNVPKFGTQEMRWNDKGED